MFSEFTLVIPTYNHHRFLRRLLGVFCTYGFPFSIVIVDSSIDPLEDDELKR